MSTVLAPVALYLASGFLLLRLAARWLRPISRWAAAVLLLLPLALTGPALLTGRVLAPIDLAYETEPLLGYRAEMGAERVSIGLFSDVASQMIPWRKAVLFAFRQGEWPLWNPFLGSGDPLAGSAQPAPYSPPHLLSLLLPLPQSFALLATLTLLLAALGAFLLARHLGCRELAALVTTAGWAMSSFLTFWLGWPLGLSAAYFPLVLLGASLVVREPGPRAGVVLGTSFVLLLLAGHPETALHAIAASALFSAFEAWRARPEKAVRVLLTGIGAGIAALGLTAVFLLPFADALEQTAEYHERGHYYAEKVRSVPLSRALENVVPQLLPLGYAAGAEPGVTAPLPHFDPATAYGGGLLLALALFGLAASREPSRWFFAGLGLFGLAAGCNFPLVADLVAKLPLFDISINERLVFYLAMALALLAGLGVEAWLAAPRGRPLATTLGAVGLALAAGAALYWPYLAAHGKAEDLLASRTAWLVAPPLVLAALAGRLSARPRLLASLLLLALIAARAAETSFLFETFPARAFYPRVAPLDQLPASETPYRIVGQGYTLIPNAGTLYELEDVRGHQAVLFRRYKELLPLWGIHQPASFTRVVDLTSPFLSFLNTRYALGTGDRPPPGWSLVGGARGAFLLRNEGALERAFVPARVRLGGDPAIVLEEMRAETNFGRRAWIEAPATAAGSGADPAVPVGEANGPGRVSTHRQGLGYRLEAELERASWIVVSVPAWRGWRARANGEDLPLAFANHAFLGIRAPRGTSTIELRFRPKSFDVGLAVSGSTVLGLAVLALVLRRRDGRTQNPRL